MFDSNDFYYFLIGRILHSGLIEIRANANNQELVFRISDFLHLLPLQKYRINNGKEGQNFKKLHHNLRKQAEIQKLSKWLDSIEVESKIVYKSYRQDII